VKNEEEKEKQKTYCFAGKERVEYQSSHPNQIKQKSLFKKKSKNRGYGQ
jgi:hypothetical protein